MDGEICLQQAYDAILQGDFELALDWFQQAIALEPDNASYYYKGSVTFARSGKLQLAKSYAQKATELAPDEPVYQLQLQIVTARLIVAEIRIKLATVSPDLVQCMNNLQEATRLDPLSVEAKLLLAIAYRMEGSYGQSLAMLSETLQLDPLNEEAIRLRQQIRVERRRVLKQQFSQQTTKRNR
ncbi:MAG: tetratricopeptide repeat protein [Candidatus Cohnella colombiensis]|uniref:Tetratricopeptide repeat protein n=1 Tax=Candidatus Cohnella colombiensis TaxID=3121368 RepID=A0AA95EYB0_9BACL|nr:MAG: tetratricopeptide repeat protein [Cohnella sp.]